MRTNVLLLVGALGILLTSTSIAQPVVSANAVGFVNISVPPNALAIIAIPLNGTNNNLNTTLPMPPGSDGCTIYRYSPISSFTDPTTWFDGFGWFNPSDPDPTIHPGESFWLQNVTSNPLQVTLIGDVPQGDLQNPVPGGNTLKMVSSQVPKTLNLGEPGLADTLNFPAADGDTVYIFDVVTQNYKDPYNYFDGFGWFSANADDPGPRGPVIPVATGFWTLKPGPAATWRQSFRVDE